MKTNWKLFVFQAIMLLFLFNACSPTKYVPNGQYIIDDVKIKCDNKNIKKSGLYSISQTRGLKKILFFYALRARIYNISNPKNELKVKQKKQKRLNRKNERIKKKFLKENSRMLRKRNIYYNRSQKYLKSGDSTKYYKALEKYKEFAQKYDFRQKHTAELLDSRYKTDVFTFWDFFHNIGQKPQLLNEYLINLTIQRFETYLKNQGYFRSKITYQIDTINNKRVRIIYYIKTGDPLTIGSVAYDLPEDDHFKILFSKYNKRIKAGNPLDINKLESYRKELVKYYRDNGYYFLNEQLITFDIDTVGRYLKAALTLKFKEDVDPKVYELWYVKDIDIFNDYSPSEAMQDSSYFENLTTIPYPDSVNTEFYFTKKYRTIIKPKYLSKELYLHTDSLYSLKSTQYTYSHLSKFTIYKLTNIEFEEDTTDTTRNYLNCNINLTPDDVTDLVYEAEVSNTSMNNGGGMNVSFVHKNLFKGGEVFNMQFKLALQKQKTYDSTRTKLFNTEEYSVDLQLVFPRLLSPIKASDFIMRNNPRTVINLNFAYQDRPEYNKISAIFTTDYMIKSSKNSSIITSPIWFSSIRVPFIAPDFEELIKQTRLSESYADHFIFGSKITYTNTNQGAEGNNYYVQVNISAAGNILNTFMKMSSDTVTGGYYYFPGFNIPYAQFVKTDLDFRYYFKNPMHQTFVTRIFLGVGLAYGNSQTMPFGEKYFVGGANSIRAWQARTLGPGEYKVPIGYYYINQLGDIKIENNFEYRFPIISVLEGAAFVDIGNIWDIHAADGDERRVFKFNKFYKQLAWGTGVGIRLNMSYFVLRLDFGLKLSDPSLQEGHRFIPFERKFNYGDVNWNFAIGYPF